MLGFTLHNITEGIGIAAPILKERPPLLNFVGLTLLAGGPAVVGLWIGSLAFAPQWSALALAIGAGAILQVIVEVTVLLRSGRGRARRDVFAGRDRRPRCAGSASCILPLCWSKSDRAFGHANGTALVPGGSLASSSGSTWMVTRTLGISAFSASSMRSQMTWLSPYRHVAVDDQMELDEGRAPGDARLQVMHLQRAPGIG